MRRGVCRGFRFLRYALPAAWLLLSGWLGADTLKFSNGDRLTGSFLREADGKIVFDAELLGEIEVDAARAEVVRAETAPVIAEAQDAHAEAEGDAAETEAGPVAKGAEAKAAASAPETANAKETTGTEAGSLLTPFHHLKSWTGGFALPFGLDAPLKKKRGGADPLAPATGRFAGTRDFLRRYYLLRDWGSQINFGYTWLSGQTDEQDLNLGFQTERQAGRNHFRARANYEYGFAESEEEKSKDTDNYNAAFRWRRHLDRQEKYFVQMRTRYQKDMIKEIDDEFEQNVGVGWRFLETKRMKASVVPSVAIKLQKISGVDQGQEYLTALFQDFSFKINEVWALQEESEFSVNPANSDLFAYDFTAGLEGKITETLLLNILWDYDYDNNVAKGIKRGEKRMVFGFGYKF